MTDQQAVQLLQAVKGLANRIMGLEQVLMIVVIGAVRSGDVTPTQISEFFDVAIKSLRLGHWEGTQGAVPANAADINGIASYLGQLQRTVESMFETTARQ